MNMAIHLSTAVELLEQGHFLVQQESGFVFAKGIDQVLAQTGRPKQRDHLQQFLEDAAAADEIGNSDFILAVKLLKSGYTLKDLRFGWDIRLRVIAQNISISFERLCNFADDFAKRGRFKQARFLPKKSSTTVLFTDWERWRTYINQEPDQLQPFIEYVQYFDARYNVQFAFQSQELTKYVSRALGSEIEPVEEVDLRDGDIVIVIQPEKRLGKIQLLAADSTYDTKHEITSVLFEEEEIDEDDTVLGIDKVLWIES